MRGKAKQILSSVGLILLTILCFIPLIIVLINPEIAEEPLWLRYLSTALVALPTLVLSFVTIYITIKNSKMTDDNNQRIEQAAQKRWIQELVVKTLPSISFVKIDSFDNKPTMVGTLKKSNTCLYLNEPKILDGDVISGENSLGFRFVFEAKEAASIRSIDFRTVTIYIYKDDDIKKNDYSNHSGEYSFTATSNDEDESSSISSIGKGLIQVYKFLSFNEKVEDEHKFSSHKEVRDFLKLIKDEQNVMFFNIGFDSHNNFDLSCSGTIKFQCYFRDGQFVDYFCQSNWINKKTYKNKDLNSVI